MDDGLLRRGAGCVAQLGDVHPVGPFCGGTLLEDRLLLDALDEAFQDHRPSSHAQQGTVGDREVVADQIQFGVAGVPVVTGKNHLVRVGDLDLVFAHVQ